MNNPNLAATCATRKGGSANTSSPAAAGKRKGGRTCNTDAMSRAVNLAMRGYVLAEIARMENIAPSTLHLWSRTHTHVAEAFKFAHESGPPLRVVEAIKGGAHTYDAIMSRSGLGDEPLGLALVTLIESGAVKTRVVTSDDSECLMALGDKRPHFEEEMRIYWLSHAAAFSTVAA